MQIIKFKNTAETKIADEFVSRSNHLPEKSKWDESGNTNQHKKRFRITKEARITSELISLRQ